MKQKLHYLHFSTKIKNIRHQDEKTLHLDADGWSNIRNEEMLNFITHHT